MGVEPTRATNFASPNEKCQFVGKTVISLENKVNNNNDKGQSKHFEATCGAPFACRKRRAKIPSGKSEVGLWGDLYQNGGHPAR